MTLMVNLGLATLFTVRLMAPPVGEMAVACGGMVVAGGGMTAGGGKEGLTKDAVRCYRS